MNPDDRVVDLADRTLANLRIIDDLSRQPYTGRQPYEVTQLVNSLLALLVVPRELGTTEFIGKATVPPHVFADGIRRWHRGPVEFELTGLDGRAPVHLKRLLGGLRNSVAHADFELLPAEGGTITAIRFTARTRARVALWSLKFKVTELEKFLVNLADELKGAREVQLSSSRIATSGEDSSTIAVELRLPTSTIKRIKRIVAAGEAASVDDFLLEAAVAKLGDEEEFPAA